MLEKLTLIALSAACSAGVANAESPIWRAQQEAIYEPSASNSDRLTLSLTSTHVYNSEGLTLETTNASPGGQRQRVSYVYTDGRVTQELTETLVGGEWQRVKLRNRTYDPQTGIITLNEEYNYVDGQAMPGNCYERRIKRDDAGNVTEVTIAVLFNGEYDETQRMTVTPTSIVFDELTFDGVGLVWSRSEEYTNIVWERTDGQIVSADDLYTGANRLLSAHYVNDNGSKPYYDYDIAATYGDDNDFDCTMSGLYQGLADAEVIRSYRETKSDDGSMTYAMTTSYDVVGSSEPAELYGEELRVDAWGLETLYRTTSWLEGEEPAVDSERITEVDYDATVGYPLKATSTENGTLLVSIEYADYVDCTQLGALRGIRVADSAAPDCFNLRGQRVSPSARGLKLSRGAKRFE